MLWTATAPRIQTTPSPTSAVSSAPSRPSTRLMPGSVSFARSRDAEALEARREAGADAERADEADRGRVRGVASRRTGPVRPGACRARPRARSRQGERPRDEPLRPSEEREQQQEPDDDPVDAGHVRDATGARCRPVAHRPLTARAYSRGVTSIHRPRHRPSAERDRGAARFAPLAIVALIAFAAGALVGLRHEAAGTTVARKWAAAWERGDYPAMHAMLSDRARRRASLKRFVRTYTRAAETVTLTKLRTGTPHRRDDESYDLPVRLRTRIFGRLSGNVRLPLIDEADGPGVDWRSQLVFPGLRVGRPAQARHDPGGARRDPRARRHAAGQGPGPPLGPRPAGGRGRRAGRAGAARARRRARPPRRPRWRAGRPQRARARVRRASSGTPGGVLRAGDRVVARAEPVAGADVRSAIDPDIQRAAVAALAGRFGGIAVLRPADRRGARALRHRVLRSQPPGSTFKIVTLAGALEAKVVKPRARFPVQTAATLEGVELRNAHGEACGGSLKQAFADSCNSVFAPLGPARGRAARQARRSASASTRIPARPARPARRSPRPRRSATTWRSGHPRSARARCSPRRSSCHGGGDDRPARTPVAPTLSRGSQGTRRARPARAPRAWSPASCAPS